jgi:hypothetical protein
MFTHMKKQRGKIGFASIPLIFHLDTVMAFNEAFVTTDVPEAKDLETPLEVGGWAWNWMEPPLGMLYLWHVHTSPTF